MMNTASFLIFLLCRLFRRPWARHKNDKENEFLIEIGVENNLLRRNEKDE